MRKGGGGGVRYAGIDKGNHQKINGYSLYIGVVENYTRLRFLLIMTNEQLQEIVDNLESGFQCSVHKGNGDIRCIPDERQFGFGDLEAWEEDIKLIKKSPAAIPGN
jgi:hypothetical protein